MPVFVISHRVQDSMADPGGSTFTFISLGIEHALAQARRAAGGRDVVIIGGAVTGRQFLVGGFLDELRLHLVHILLDAGTRLFEPSCAALRQLKATRLVEDTGVTHFIFDSSVSRSQS